MASVNPSFVGRAIVAASLQIVFTIYLFVLTWVAIDRGFLLAAIVFFVFAIGLLGMTFRKVQSEFYRLHYNELFVQQVE